MYGATPTELTTARLRMRRHRSEDAGELARLIDNWNIVRWLAEVPFPYTEDDARKWIAQTHRNWQLAKDFQFVVTRADDGGMVGHIGLRIAPSGLEPAGNGHSPALRGREGELGYWFGEAFWGQGLAAEAARATVQFGFRYLRLERIWAASLPDNAGSLRVLDKAGLTFVARQNRKFSVRRSDEEVPILAIRAADYWAKLDEPADSREADRPLPRQVGW